MSSGRQAYIRISLFAKRKEGISSEQFHKHWSGVHADVVRALPGYPEVCKRYVQFHALPEHQAQDSIMGLEVLKYDGIVEIWVESAEHYTAHMSDVNIIKTLADDEQHFVDRSKSAIMVGYETLEIGQPIPGHRLN